MDGEEVGYTLTVVPSSMITPSTNPKANGWYEFADDDEFNINPIRTQDTSPVDGKFYYMMKGDDETMSEANAIAYSTYQTYLMYRTTSSGSYDKLIDIKDYPDMLGEPNMLEATTLSDGQEKKIAGILRLGDGFQFTANYTVENFNAVKELEGHTYWYGLWLGGTTAGVPDGHHGKFEWTGDIRAGFPGKGVDEVRDMSVTCTPYTDVEWSAT